MLTLDRIMEIAEAHASHCTSPGAVGGEHHNIQVLSVAIQEALSENDEKKKSRNRKELRRALTTADPYAKSNGAHRGS